MAFEEDELQRTAATTTSGAPALRRSLGTQIGSSAREGAQRAIGSAGAFGRSSLRRAEGLAAMSAAPALAAANTARDAGAALRGNAAPAPLSFPRPSQLRMPAIGAGTPGAPGAITQPSQRTSPATRYVPRRAEPAAGERAGDVPATNVLPGRLHKNAALRPGDVNTFTGSNGVTRAVPGMLRRPGQEPAAEPPPAGVSGPTPVVAERPTQASVRGRQGAIIANPGDSIESRLTRAMGSASLRGSPSARAAVARAILDEAGAAREERQSALAVGDQADLANLQANNQAQESFLQRQQRASEFNTAAQEARSAREFEAANRAPTITPTDDGSMGIVSPTGTWAPVTDASGARLRAPSSIRQTGELSQGDLLKSYTDRYNAIAGGLGAQEEKQTQLDALNADPLYAQLPGRGQAAGAGAPPSYEEFVADARQKGSRMSDADLRSFYDTNFGR